CAAPDPIAVPRESGAARACPGVKGDVREQIVSFWEIITPMIRSVYRSGITPDMLIAGANVFVFGKKLYGKCDEVPGLFHVATLYYHFNYLPIAPIQSYIILAKDGDKFKGVPIPLNSKSFMLNWIRFVSLLAFAISGFVVVAPLIRNGVTPGLGDLGPSSVFCVTAFAIWIFAMSH